MNLKYTTHVELEIMNTLNAKMFFKVSTSDWFSLISFSLKKKGKVQICMYFWKLNVMTKKDPFIILFMDSILEELGGHEIYFILDGLLGYDQINIVNEDRSKTRFAWEYGIYACNKMPFGLWNAPRNF